MNLELDDDFVERCRAANSRLKAAKVAAAVTRASFDAYWRGLSFEAREEGGDGESKRLRLLDRKANQEVDAAATERLVLAIELISKLGTGEAST